MNILNNFDKSVLDQKNIIHFDHFAMHTVLDLYLNYEDIDYSSQAANEAFRITDLLEQELSKFLPNSEVSRINNSETNQSFIISEDTFNCLKNCSKMFEITDGIFDVTAGNIFDSWKFNHAQRDDIKDLEKKSEFPVILNEENYSIKLGRPVSLDFGGYAKGYAVNKIKDLLLEWDIDNFLISLGKSSVFAEGTVKGFSGWPVSVKYEKDDVKINKNIELKRSALSGSGVQKGSHIINPATNEIAANLASWVLCEDAALADALSTSFMLMKENRIREISEKMNVSAIVVCKYGKMFSAGNLFDSIFS